MKSARRERNKTTERKNFPAMENNEVIFTLYHIISRKKVDLIVSSSVRFSSKTYPLPFFHGLHTDRKCSRHRGNIKSPLI